jgi:chromatin remodeling complex protein RSC6
LAAIVGSAPLARDEIMKRLWNYINEHGLNDKRVIWADNKLRPIIGADSISMFRLPMLLGKHLT